MAAAYLVRGLPAWRAESARALHLPVPWEPGAHPGGPTTLLIAGSNHLTWALNRIAQVPAAAPAGGFALLTDAASGSPALLLPVPIQVYQLGPLWLLTDWALRNVGCTQQNKFEPVQCPTTCARVQVRDGQHRRTPPLSTRRRAPEGYEAGLGATQWCDLASPPPPWGARPTDTHGHGSISLSPAPW